MANLKLVVDSIDSLEESVRGYYVEKDGKFVLDVDGIEDTSGLKNALSAERKRADAAEKQRKAWEKIGKTPDEIAELLEAQQQRETTEAERKGEWDKLRGQMNERHAKELQAKDDQISSLRKSLERHLIDAQATSAIAAEKGIPDLLLPHVQRHVRVVESDGEFSVRVVNDKGDPRVNGKGEPLTISDLIAEMKTNQIFGRAFEGAGQSGSGTPPANGGGGNPSNKRRSDFKDEKERAAFVNQHGLAAYQSLPA